MRNVLSVLSVGFSLTLAGCGGGGGDTSSQPATSNSNATVVVASNMDQVSRSSNAAAGAATSSANPELATLLVGGVETQPTTQLMQGALPAAVAVSERLQALRTQPDFVGGVASSKQTACKKAGSATVSLNYASTTVYTVGDTGSIVFTACDDGAGFVLSGKVSSTVHESKGSSSSSTVGMTMVFENYKAMATTSAVGTTLNGTADLTLIVTSESVKTMLGAKTFNVAYGSESFAMTSLAVINIVNKATGESTQSVYELFVHTLPGTQISGKIAGSVSVKAGAITGGNLRFYGNASDVYLTYLGNGNVKVDADFDGNDTTDSTKTTTLAALN